MRYFDMHCDTLCRCADEKVNLEKNSFNIDICRLSEFEKAVQVFACFIDDKYYKNEAENRFWQLFDIYKNTDFKKVTPVLSIENLNCLNGNIDNIYKLKECGVKIASLVWNGKNEIASGVCEQGGITDFGREVIKTLEQENIVIDVSHLNKQGFYDLCDIATKPFIATHSNSYEICGHIRNLDDDQFKIIAQSGGVVGLNFYKLFVSEKENGFEDFLRHIDRFLSLGGEKVIGLGSDFDGCDLHNSIQGVQSMPAFYDYLVNKLSKSLANRVVFDNCNEFFKLF